MSLLANILSSHINYEERRINAYYACENFYCQCPPVIQCKLKHKHTFDCFKGYNCHYPIRLWPK